MESTINIIVTIAEIYKDGEVNNKTRNTKVPISQNQD